MSDEEKKVTINAIVESIQNGASVMVACEAGRIGRTTFYKWMKEDEEFKDAIEQAKASRITMVEDALYRSAVFNENVTAMIFFLTNRAPHLWADKRAVVNNTIVNTQKNLSIEFQGEDKALADDMRRRLEEKYGKPRIPDQL